LLEEKIASEVFCSCSKIETVSVCEIKAAAIEEGQVL